MAQKTDKIKGSPNGGTERKSSVNGNQTNTGKFSKSKNGGAVNEDERAAKRKAAALATFEAAYDNHNKTR